MTVHFPRLRVGMLKRRIRAAVAIVIAMLPALGVLSEVSTSPASADGPAIVLPAAAFVKAFLAGLGNG